MLYIALIVYCTIAFGIHGGELVSGINRQVRNLICALPFGFVCWFLFDAYIGLMCFALAYGGTSLEFNSSTVPMGQPTSLWLAAKGFITCPFGGFIALPLAYFIGYKTKWKNVLAEYLSGTFYGVILSMLIIFLS